jgi:hypothetical protein
MATTQQTHDELEAGEKIDFTYKTVRTQNRLTITDGEVLDVGHDTLIVEAEFVGVTDTYVLMGYPGKLKQVYKRREGKPDQFLGDKGRIN